VRQEGETRKERQDIRMVVRMPVPRDVFLVCFCGFVCSGTGDHLV
jgi:hypothetical protein